jgi:hypothetical protein
MRRTDVSSPELSVPQMSATQRLPSADANALEHYSKSEKTAGRP